MLRIKRLIACICILMLLVPSLPLLAEKRVDIQFNLNGGLNQEGGDVFLAHSFTDADDGAVDKQIAYTLPEAVPYKAGFLFDGWRWESDIHWSDGPVHEVYHEKFFPADQAIESEIGEINETWTFVATWETAGMREIPTEIYINRTLVPTDVPPMILSGRTMVPVRVISESLGCDVAYEQPFGDRPGVVLIQRDDTRIELGIGDPWASVDHQDVQLYVPPEIINGRTLVPLRFVSQALGASVHWLPARTTAEANLVVIEE